MSLRPLQVARLVRSQSTTLSKEVDASLATRMDGLRLNSLQAAATTSTEFSPQYFDPALWGFLAVLLQPSMKSRVSFLSTDLKCGWFSTGGPMSVYGTNCLIYKGPYAKMGEALSEIRALLEKSPDQAFSVDEITGLRFDHKTDKLIWEFGSGIYRDPITHEFVDEICKERRYTLFRTVVVAKACAACRHGHVEHESIVCIQCSELLFPRDASSLRQVTSFDDRRIYVEAEQKQRTVILCCPARSQMWFTLGHLCMGEVKQ